MNTHSPVTHTWRSPSGLEPLVDDLKILLAGRPGARRGVPGDAVGLLAGRRDETPLHGVLRVATRGGVGELPVGGLAVVVEPLEADPVVVAVLRPAPVGLLRLPVGNRVGLGLLGVIDDQQPVALG